MLSRISRPLIASNSLRYASALTHLSYSSSHVVYCVALQLPNTLQRVQQVRFFSKSRKEVELTDRVLTVPNVMSGIRFLLAPTIGYMTLKGLFMPSLATFAFASLLDFCDGYVARTFNQRSRLGTLIDPIADKTLMVCLAASMGYVGLIHAPVAALIIGKDVLMGLGFFALAYKHGYRSPKQMVAMVKALEVKPSMLGKANTALQMVLFILGMCRPLWGIPSVQLFLPLEGIVSLTTVGTLLSYAMTVNKAVKWDVVDKTVKGSEMVKNEDMKEKESNTVENMENK